MKRGVVMHAYLDNSATTRPFDEVIEYMQEMMRFHYGNPSSMHRVGIDAEIRIKEIRKQIMKSLKAPEGEVVFTSGGTEANNLAIFGSTSLLKKRKPHIVCVSTEHKSVLAPIKELEASGHTVTYLEVDAFGKVDPKAVMDAVTEQTGLVSMMYINNETGALQPVELVGKALKKLKEPPVFHVDAVQAYGKITVDVNRACIDLLSASGHKIHGPKGIGFLFLKKGIRLKPQIFGGGQQNDLRPGTENTYAIYGLSKAIELNFEKLAENELYLRALKMKFMSMIKDQIPNCIVHSELNDAPHIVNVSFPGIRGEVLLHSLESVGVFVSTGSACNSKNKLYSHVLTAMGLSHALMESAIRFSFSIMNTEEEVEYAVTQVKTHYESLYQIIKGR